MKRALKKRVKAVLKNTPSSEGAPVEQSNMSNSVSNHRARTQVAMIGLAISMGATSLLVTRQSDQAQAAAPVGSQKAASTIPAAPDTEMKFAPTKLENQTVSLVSVPENPVIVEPTAISQVPGLEAKLQVAASGMSVPVPVSEITAKTTATYKSSFYQQPQVVQGLQAANKLKEVQKLSIANSVVNSPTTSLTAVATENATANSEVTAQLKAQQEFALNRLQEKSNRLKQSLAELRSEESKNLSQANVELSQPTAVVEKAPQLNASNIRTEQSPTTTDASQASLISKLKQAKAASTPLATPVPATLKAAVPSATVAYEVKSGDTLAAIASRYGTSVSELAKANHLSNPNQLQISQKLIVPSASPSKLAINPTVEQSDATAKVAPSPVNTAIVNPTLTVTPQLPVVANNSSVTIPTPVATSNPIPANTAIASETVPVPTNSYGMGGDTPVPKVFAEMQLNQKPQKLASNKSNERLQSLQAEIQRLREKYRAQQAGIVTPAVSENNNPAVAVPVGNPNNFAVSSPTSPRSAVQIAVPSPNGTANYSLPQMKPLYRATQPTNEPVNPEFFSNQAPGRRTPAPRIATPSRGVNASDSLGKMRGTTVSPGLPPLSAVDQYLPKPIDETIPPPSSSSVAYIWPAKGVLTSGYGWRWGKMHKGIDVANSTGTPVYASADGVIEKAGWNNGGYGNLVDIRHPDGSMTRYGHNSKILVQPGQQVRQGETIALMGSTGFSTGPHSHFEIHPTGKGAVNPITYLANRI
ncbi:MAG: peptidoglycan DD-metalloendopeptidase family protein [Aulosira sp. ZfuVER01]|nr:peptidoglycan DD-metalloendopeptidase family protein [Aulosira sp. ZfuVER01]MDZ8002744.1 peptidoglycan DD-metalloendopeptidase family protein [Aulosira sp. DedVER01a]MDZ8054438.1 peptidoglycan DD-metalloendopeptidase family protein [Aulosira sp. ZfuCHP01]